MGILASIGKGFKVAFSSWPVIGVTFAFGLVFNLVNLALAPEGPANPNTPPSPPLIVASLLFILITIFLQAGSVGYILDKLRQGSAQFSTFVKSGTRFYLRILALSLIIALVIGVFAVLAAVAGGLLAGTNRPAAIAAIVVIALIGIACLLLLFFAPYIAIAEDKGVLASLGASARIVKANFGWVFLLALLLVLIGFVIGLSIGILVGLLSRVIPPDAAKVAFAVVSALVNAILGLIVAASFMNYYLGKKPAA